jgi:hypothetical protein
VVFNKLKGGGYEILEERGKKEYGNRKNVKESSRGMISERK